MNRLHSLLVLVLVSAASPVIAQQSTPGAPSGIGVIEGRVTDAATGGSYIDVPPYDGLCCGAALSGPPVEC